MKTLFKIFLTSLFVVMILASFLIGRLYETKRIEGDISSHPLLAKRIFLSKPNDILVNFEPLRSELKENLEYYDEA